MASMRFENNEFLAGKKGGKVWYFDNSIKLIFGTRYANYDKFELVNERLFRNGEKQYDIMASKNDGKAVKLGEIFRNEPDWPGGPCPRMPTSTGEIAPASTAVPIF
jgi:hypothetical protein